jgi:16S rRNA (adenine1518-N6/adenine1519-N6)-dimethyltransferase
MITSPAFIFFTKNNAEEYQITKVVVNHVYYCKAYAIDIDSRNFMLHRPRKRFGQHFLQDTSIIQTMIRAIHPQKTDHIIEIGPGLGALTYPLLREIDTLTAIEIDTDLLAKLAHFSQHQQPITLIQADALTVDFSALGTHLRIIGNLPYNISTPLIMHLLQHKTHIDDMHFMLQKEVVDRLAAPPGCKAYGRLSIMVQYLCDVECLFFVPPEAFYPPPKVESAVVRLTPHTQSPYPSVCLNTLKQVVATAFAMRRKTIANNLKPLLTAKELEALTIDPLMRPEQLSILTYVQIAQFVTDSGKIPGA